MLNSLFYILVFPGILFLAASGLVLEFVDRKIHARLQHRAGPPWYQPVADFIKLVSKEDLVPEAADRFIFKFMPLLALASATVAIFYIPIWKPQAIYFFEGDLVVILYFLTIPTLCFFLAGWFSSSVYASLGAVRVLTQFFAYEVPLFIAVLAPAILAGSWSLSAVVSFYQVHPLYALSNLPGFFVALVALLGKLEKTPFDIPEAETEIVGGVFTEYSGRLLAFFRVTMDVETIVVASLLSAVFIPWGMNFSAVVVFLLYCAKVLLIVALISLLRTIFARLRLEQMVDWCWKWIAPTAMLQMVISLALNGVLPR